MTVDNPQPARPEGFWRRVWRRIFGRRDLTSPPLPPAGAESATAVAPRVLPSQSVDAGEPLAIPARGEVFDFQVQVEATWRADVPDAADLRGRVDRQVESVRRAVRDLIWPIGRDHLPHRAGDAEIAMSAQLPPEFCFDDAGTSLRCQVKLRVRPDARVVEHLGPYWRRYLEMDAEHLLGELRADQVAALARRWREVLTDQAGVDLGDLVLPYAAQLTEPQFAAVVTGLENERRRSRLELTQVLDRAAKSHTRVGLFEFAEAYNAALDAFKRNQGLTDDDGDQT